jgi:hypothetical protein
MDVFFETLRIMGVGMLGIFTSILVFYFMIKSMLKFSEE